MNSLKAKLKRSWYKYVHGINLGGFDGTMLPSTGKGDFVSVYNKGGIIDIVNENKNMKLGNLDDNIRIIPCQINHGVMVERIIDGKVFSRNHLSLRQLNKDIIYASNVEELAGRENIVNTYKEKILEA